MAKLKSFMINTALVIVSTVISCILIEFGARLYFFGSLRPLQTKAYGSFRKPTEKFGWRLMPNIDVWLRRLDYSVRYRTNSHGFHDVEREYTKPDETYRIAVLGDSFMESYVVNYKDSFAAVLENNLNKKLKRNVEVINLGVGGYGTVQEYLMQVSVAEKYDPDMIILSFLIVNDIRNNSLALENSMWPSNALKVRGRPYVAGWKDDGRPELTLPEPEYIADRVEAFEGIKEREEKWLDGLIIKDYIDRFRTGLKEQDQSIRRDPNAMLGLHLKEFDGELGKGLGREDHTTEEWARMWGESAETTYRLIQAMQKRAHENDSAFCVFAIPARIVLEEDKQMAVKKQFPEALFDFDAPHVQFRQNMERMEIDHLDLLPHFREIYGAGGGPLYNQIADRHWNVKGYRVAGGIVADFLIPRISTE